MASASGLPAESPHQPGPLTDTRKSLASLQLLRFAAALAVVVCHSRSLYEHLGGDGAFFSAFVSHGALGVPVFFVISGFVIFGAATRAKSPADFLRRRLTRIYPPLWAAIGILLFVLWLIDDLAWITPSSLFHSLTLIDLSPSGDSNVLFVAWTLSYELLFYLTVAALLILPLRVRTAMSVGLVCALVIATYALGQWVPSLFANPLTFCFVFGVAAASANVPRKAAWPLAGVAVGLWVLGLTIDAESSPTLTAVLFGGGSALLLSAVKTSDLHGPFASVSRWAGDASYALYLTHPFVLVFLLGSGWYLPIAAQLSTGGLIAVYVIAALIIGALFHVVERGAGKLVERASSALGGKRPAQACLVA